MAPSRTARLPFTTPADAVAALNAVDAAALVPSPADVARLGIVNAARAARRRSPVWREAVAYHSALVANIPGGRRATLNDTGDLGRLGSAITALAPRIARAYAQRHPSDPAPF